MLTSGRGQRPLQPTVIRGERGIAGELLSSAIAVTVLMVVLATLFRLATGMSPWPVFVLVELPTAAVAFALLSLTAPR